MSEVKDELINIAQDVISTATKSGATVAEVVIGAGQHLSTKVRLGEAELVEEAGSRSLGLRVMVGQQVAVTYSSDFSSAGRQRLVSDAIELATLSESDPFAGAPDPSLLSKPEEHMDLDSFDPEVDAVDGGAALAAAKKAEKAAFDYDERIKNSDGATFTRASGENILVTNADFVGASRGTYASLVVNPIVDDEGGKKRSGYYWTARRHLNELKDAKEVGEEAARRTLAQLGAEKIPTGEMPIVFDPDAGRSIIGLMAGCVMGGAIWRKSSYLAGRLGTQVASELITLVDDPLIPRAPGSRAFDGEGLLARKNVVVEKGELKTYLLDSYSGRKLDMQSTANASRSSSGGVGTTTSNFVLQAGTTKREDLLKSTKYGLYVTSMMGYGFNAVTGDFSRGASGFLIENGELTRPVSEVTISLNIDDMFKRIDAVADDLDFRTSTVSPTFRISAMTVAGD